MNLRDKRCVPCKAGEPPLGDAALALLLPEVPGWTSTKPSQEKPRQLQKRFVFPDFLGAMSFLNRVATVAEDEQHHPDFSVHYNRVDMTLWTHAVGGLSENDFILATKIDAVAG